MEYLSTAIVQPQRESSSDPQYVGHITVRMSDKEVEKFFGFGNHQNLRRRMPDALSSLSAGGTRATDVPGFQDVSFEVMVRGDLDAADIDQWGRSRFQQIREILEQL